MCKCERDCVCVRVVSHVSLRILRCSKASRPREFTDISTSRPSMMSNRKGRALTMTLWDSAPRDRTTPFSSWDRRDMLRRETARIGRVKEWSGFSLVKMWRELHWNLMISQLLCYTVNSNPILSPKNLRHSDVPLQLISLHNNKKKSSKASKACLHLKMVSAGVNLLTEPRWSQFELMAQIHAAKATKH